MVIVVVTLPFTRWLVLSFTFGLVAMSTQE